MTKKKGEAAGAVQQAAQLVKAARDGRMGAARRLLKAGCDVNKAAERGVTALYAASQNGHVDVMQLLLARQDISVNQADERGTSPLHVAAEEGHAACVKLLLAHKDILINHANQQGATAIFFAAQEGKPACMRELSKARRMPV